jgi:hypothetical protein
MERRRNSTHLYFRWFPNWQVKSHHQSLLNCPLSTRQKRTAFNASMRQWFNAINGAIIIKNNHLHVSNCHLPPYLSRWLACNKIHTVEIMRFLVKYHESDHTNQQDGCTCCCGEGDRSGPGVATVFAMLEAMRWRRWKSSWWGRSVTRFLFFGSRRIWYALYGRQM